MGFSFCNRFAGLIVLAALVTGCGQSGSGAAVSPNSGIRQEKGQRTSVRHGSLSHDSLIYVTDGNGLEAFETDGTLVQTINASNFSGDICSDSQGNVWIPTSSNSSTGTLVEYAHGGTTPIATVSDNDVPQACAVDPSTGNLAAANQSGNVAIYQNAQGSPTYYPTGILYNLYSAGYDANGDLFVTGYKGPYKTGTRWLRKGSNTVTGFRLKPNIFPHGGLAWDGQYLTVSAGTQRFNRYAIKATKGKSDGTFSLSVCCMGHFAIHKSLLVSTDRGYSRLQFFAYPKGGDPTMTLTVPYADGVTVSVPPSR